MELDPGNKNAGKEIIDLVEINRKREIEYEKEKIENIEKKYSEELGKDNNTLLMAQAADQLFIRGDLKESEDLCDYILSRLDSEYDWPMLTLAKIYTAEKRYDEAYSLLDKLEKKKETYEIHLLRAQTLSGEGKYREADPEFLKAIGMKPDDAYLHEMRAWNLKNYDPASAEAEFSRSLKLNPENLDVFIALSKQIDTEISDITGDAGDRYVLVEDKSQKVLMAERIEDELKPDKYKIVLAEEKEEKKEEGGLTRRGTYDSVEGKIDKALDSYKDDKVFLAAKADILLRKENEQDIKKSEEICKYILNNIDNNYEWAMLILAKIFIKEGRISEANEIIDKIQGIRDTYEVHLLRGEVLRSRNRYKEADKEYQKAISLNPAMPYLHEIRAWNLRNFDMKESELELKRALALSPEDPHLLMALSYHYRSRRLYKEGNMYLKKAVGKADDEEFADINRNIRNDYFSQTGTSGYHFGLPASVSFGYRYEPELSNIENMIRGLRFDKVSRDSEDLPPAQLTKGNFVESNVNLNFSNLPLIHNYFSYDRKIDRQDPLVEDIELINRTELEHTFPDTFMGDITVFPYFKYAYLHGSNFSIDKIFQSDFRIDIYNFGIRALPAWIFEDIGVKLETEYVFGVGDYRDAPDHFRSHQLRARLLKEFPDKSYFFCDGEVYYSIQGPDYPNYDYRYKGVLFFDKNIHNEKLRIFAELEAVYHLDTIKTGPDIDTIIIKPRGGIKFKLNDIFSLRASGSYFHCPGYDTFDYWELRGEFVYKDFVRNEQVIEGREISFQNPVEFIIGYKADIFPRFPRSRDKNLTTVYCESRYFW